MAVAVLDAHPDAAQDKYPLGWLPLHGAPAEVALAVLEAHREIVKAALRRGVVMLRDVAWELRDGKPRSTTARGTQRKSKLRSKTSSCDLTTLWTSCHMTSAAPENARESMRT